MPPGLQAAMPCDDVSDDSAMKPWQPFRGANRCKAVNLLL